MGETQSAENTVFNTREGEEKSQKDAESEPGMVKKFVRIMNKQNEQKKIPSAIYQNER